MINGGILEILGILFLTFIIIPWVGMLVWGCIKAWLDENDRFDG